MKKTLVSLTVISLFIASCQKEIGPPPPAPEAAAIACIIPLENPNGRSYPLDSVVAFPCDGNFCGVLPLNNKNYWIYLDSIYNNGVLWKVQYDTLRFTDTYRTNDNLVWWEPNMEIGLPGRFYANDSAFFKMEERMFVGGIFDVRKDYSLFTGDSLRWLASFSDIAAQGRSLKLTTPVTAPSGTFDECIYFEKHARNYRRDQLYFRRGIGVIRYIREEAPMGTRTLLLQQVSTLVKYSIQ